MAPEPSKAVEAQLLPGRPQRELAKISTGMDKHPENKISTFITIEQVFIFTGVAVA
jgi:hypothetical protein